jgi:hypothetical protein
MISINKELTEKYQEFEVITGYVVMDARCLWQAGVKEAEGVHQKEWSNGSVMWYNTIEVWATRQDAEKYRDYLKYMPDRKHVILEVAGFGEDVIGVCKSGFCLGENSKPYYGTQIGFRHVEVSSEARKAALNG